VQLDRLRIAIESRISTTPLPSLPGWKPALRKQLRPGDRVEAFADARKSFWTPLANVFSFAGFVGCW
jgi:hypothetical protein